MENREEDALNDVDRISVAVGHLRKLLIAATEAELRAQRRPAPPDTATDG